MVAPQVDIFPDVELVLVAAFAPMFPQYRFCTVLPASMSLPTCRFKRISGAARDIRNDRPIVDADVFSPDYGTSSLASRTIQAALLSLRGRNLMNGVVQHVSVIQGPRWLQDANQEIQRFNATYEILIHNP